MYTIVIECVHILWSYDAFYMHTLKGLLIFKSVGLLSSLTQQHILRQNRTRETVEAFALYARGVRGHCAQCLCLLFFPCYLYGIENTRRRPCTLLKHITSCTICTNGFFSFLLQRRARLNWNTNYYNIHMVHPRWQ